MKRLFILLLLSVSFCTGSFAQEWFLVSVDFNLSDVKSKRQLKNYRFSYLPGSRTNSENLSYSKKTGLFNISFMSMGGGILLILYKENDKMLILINRGSKKAEPITIPFYKDGIFEITGASFRKITDPQKVENIDTYIKNSTEHEMEIVLRKNKAHN